MGAFSGPAGASRIAGAGLLAGLVVVLAACGGSQSGRNMAAVLMGPAPDEEVEMVGSRPDRDPGPPCPGITTREGTQVLRVYERGREGEPRHLRYQGTVSELVRECNFDADEQGVTIRAGVAGRLITGPAGGPGSFELPVRVAVVQVGGEAVWSQLYRIPVTVQQGEANVAFRHVAENIRIEIPAGRLSSNFVVFAGFDAM